MKRFLIIVVAFLLANPAAVGAAEYTYDLGLSRSDISFSQPIESLIAGSPVRVYATIHNFGEEDVLASVVFFSGSALITETQPVSVKSGGLADEVFIDWTVPSGSFNVVVEIRASDPGDQHLLNNKAMTELLFPKEDTDGDSIPDDVDSDDDNDGLPDDQEEQIGTSPTNHDTDNDGVNDGDDHFPLDKTRSTAPPEPDPEPEPEPQTAVLGIKIDADDDEEPAKNDEEEITENKDDENKANDEDEEEKKNEAPLELTDELKKILGADFISTVEIKSEKIGWGEYSFNYDTNIGDIDTSLLEFEWDFGDGTITTKNETHKFGIGTHHVKLKLTGPYGNNISDVITIDVSFWNMANVLMWGAIGLPLILLLLFLAWIKKRKKKNKSPKKLGKSLTKGENIKIRNEEE